MDLNVTLFCLVHLNSIDSSDLQWLNMFCVSEIISNLIFSENYKYRFILFDLYISFERVKRGEYIHIFHQYKKLILLEKSSEIHWVFCRISYTFKKIRGIIYYFFITYYMIDVYVSRKVYIKWQIKWQKIFPNHDSLTSFKVSYQLSYHSFYITVNRNNIKFQTLPK